MKIKKILGTLFFLSLAVVLVSCSNKTFEVVFYDWDNTVLDTQKVEEGSVATAPKNPTREGYDFLGWNKEYTNITEDIEITATYQINTYTIVWKNHDGSVLATDSNIEWGSTPSYGGTTPTKAATAEFDYTFIGWSPTVEVATSNQEYVAQFSETIKTYTVIWKNHDGFVLETDQVAYGEVPTYGGLTPTKEKTAQYTYTFSNWEPAISAVNENQEYTAQFSSTVNSYEVTFKDWDGSELKKETVLYGAEATAPEVPSREGYIFKGWNKIFNNVTENMTVYTVWEIKPSGDISIEILDGEYLGKDVYALDVDNELFSLPLIGVVKTHEKASWKLYFDIYATNEILSKTVYLDIGDNIFYILITAEDGNIKLNTIIIRRLPIYTVSFNTQGGSYISPQYIQEKDFVKDPNSPTKTGYTFDKWDFNFDSPILGDITINALWTSNKYKITYDTNGGILNNNNIHEVAFGSSYALREPIRVGYTFDGWYEGSNKFIQQSYWYIARNIELTAKWKANEYMITYDPNGGTLNSNTQKVFYADGYTLKEPTREGYTFKGWYIDNNKIEDGIWNIASNKTLVAKWEANKYQINYDISDELMEQTQIVMYDNQYELITPKREDFIFIGWYYNNILFTNGIWDLLNDITLTPKWSLENITLSGETYIYNGEVRSLEIEGKLPEGIEVDYINNDKVNAGDYQVTAKFVDTTGIIENIESLYANLVIKILQPQNVSINNGILSWDEVEGAVSYKVIVNDIEYITTNTYYNFSTVDTINIYVISINGNGQSDKAGIIYVENGKTYINYGKYPQTVVSDNSLILALNNLTETNSEGYYEYEGNEYAKLKTTSSSSSYKFSDDTTIVSGTTYYFKVEPIKWRVISNNDGTIQLLSEYILDSQYYHTSTSTRSIDGKTIYSNNYEHSYIRKWLNNSFYNKAFGTLDQNAILTTLVDNSASTTNSLDNIYESNNTNDKIYLLSYKDAINSSYGFATSTSFSDTRYAITTDYARAKGAYMSTSTSTYGNGLWWLRSPYGYNYHNASTVSTGGYVDYYNVYDAHLGVRPALQIK